MTVRSLVERLKDAAAVAEAEDGDLLDEAAAALDALADALEEALGFLAPLAMLSGTGPENTLAPVCERARDALQAAGREAKP